MFGSVVFVNVPPKLVTFPSVSSAIGVKSALPNVPSDAGKKKAMEALVAEPESVETAAGLPKPAEDNRPVFLGWLNPVNNCAGAPSRLTVGVRIIFVTEMVTSAVLDVCPSDTVALKTIDASAPTSGATMLAVFPLGLIVAAGPDV